MKTLTKIILSLVLIGSLTSCIVVPEGGGRGIMTGIKHAYKTTFFNLK